MIIPVLSSMSESNRGKFLALLSMVGNKLANTYKYLVPSFTIVNKHALHE